MMKQKTVENIGVFITTMCELAPELRPMATGRIEQTSTSESDYSVTQVAFKGPKNETLAVAGMSTGKIPSMAIGMVQKTLEKFGWEDGMKIEDVFFASAKQGSIAWVIDKDKITIIPFTGKPTGGGTVIARQ